MGPGDLAPYIALAILLGAFLTIQIRRDTERRETVRADMKANFFPQFIAALKAVEKKLGEEEAGEGYLELLSQGWKPYR